MGTKKRQRGDPNAVKKGQKELATAISSLHATMDPSAVSIGTRMDAMQMMSNSFQRNVHDIERVIGGPAGNTGTCVPSGAAFESREVEPVTRAWEERFLHEPYGAQRPCAAVSDPDGCWASKLFINARAKEQRGPLTLVEFYTPTEYEQLEASGWKWPQEKQLCLLCLRVATHRLFVQRRASNGAVPAGVHFNKISNLTGIAGEYELSDCFVSAPDRFEGLVDPVVIPRLTDYDVCVVNGVRCVRQRHAIPGATHGGRLEQGTGTDFRV